jgi:hypothetical protein
MTEIPLLLVTCALVLAAILIPVPPRGRLALWGVMLGSIVAMWV